MTDNQVIKILKMLDILCRIVRVLITADGLGFTVNRISIRFIMAAYVADADIIFLHCDFYLLFLYSSPNLSGRRLDVYHTSTHDVALVRI